MTIFFMSFEDYKEFFNEKTKIDDCDFVELEVEGIENKQDKECEYSIKWKINSVDGNFDYNEKGKITKINTSSIFSLKSCYWDTYEDDEEEKEND